jgi:pSer/pThr/pTyr-binding forkhead associated (FHA) protein
MPARLVSLDGRDNILLDCVLFVVGRHTDSDVTIDSSRVSRRHCCLAVDRDGILVRDLGSRNGTWVNGRKIKVAVIRRGDELRIAHLRYRLEIEDENGDAVPAQPRFSPESEDGPHRDDTMPARPQFDSLARRNDESSGNLSNHCLLELRARRSIPKAMD